MKFNLKSCWLPVFLLLANILPAAPKTEYWYGIYMQNQLIGWTRTVSREDHSTIRIENESRMSLKAMGVAINIDLRSSTTLRPKDYQPLYFYYSLKGGIQNTEVIGTRRGDTFALAVNNGYATENHEYPAAGLSLPAAADYLLAKEKLALGWKKNITIFSPEMMREIDLVMTVTGERNLTHRKPGSAGRQIPVPCFIVETKLGSLSMLSFIGKQDNICYRIDQPAGITMLLAEKEELMKRFTAARTMAVDVMENYRVPVSRRLPEKPVAVKLKITPPLSSADRDLDGPFQRVEHHADYSLVTIETRFEPSAALPASEYTDTREYQKPLITRAREIIGSVSDSRERARLIFNWLQKNINKQMTFSIPDPLQVLATGQGDCNEFSVLYTALCRLAGIPARSVIGLTGMGDGFYYHAWNEILTGDGWQASDAALGQFRADAAHLRLAAVEPDDLLKMAGMIKNYSIEVVDAR